MIHQTSRNLRHLKKQNLQILTDCPVTGEQAKKLTETHIVFLNEQAIWWHCSACWGWHIVILGVRPEPEKSCN